MKTRELAIDFSDNSFSIKTSSCLSIENCNALFIAERGELPVREAPSLSLGVETCFNAKRLSENSIEFWLSAKNLSDAELKIKNITMFDGTIEASGKAWKTMHGEFFKKEEYFNGFSYYTGNLIEPMKDVKGEFGKSEDTPFPGIFFMHPEYGNALISVLSQEKCKPCWAFDGKGNVKGEDVFSGIPYINLKPGETFESERWLVHVSDGTVEEIIDEYYGFLKERYKFPGAVSSLREELVWGSWNYNERKGGHGDINHDYIMANARALSENLKKVRWMMIDDGYQKGVDIKRKSDIIGIDTFYGPPDFHCSTARFPHGMTGLVKGIEKAGLKPAIWSSPVILNDSALAKKHPEWLLKFSDNRAYSGKTAYLDYSIPEARDYVRSAWNIIFNEWGFKGLKCDFWTPAFEADGIEFANKNMTAIQLRNMFLKDICDMKPNGAFLLTCCTINAGNPFLGIYAEASRSSNDVGSGDWDAARSCAKWLSVSSLFYRGDCLLADADSIGWNNSISKNENELWATFAMMAGGMYEIGGDMTKLNVETKRFFDTVVNFFKPAEKCIHNLLGDGIGNLPVSQITLKRPDASFDAYLNWNEYPCSVNVALKGNDLWTGRQLCNGEVSRLEKHAPLLIKRT